MSGDPTDWYRKVHDLFLIVDDMNDWEYDFVNNVTGYEHDGRIFTEKQEEVIDRLHNKYC